ncbi:hypothetical protein DL764_010039 [Monosporascus ibericus]|uniref:Uncharacterized protein n=1 Tax=Monosporascus ibericus TaxID=155417 RepID=A0A4Q4STH1_9PEZI|nr:hypothetical protein DL764_010039 [Monosporascus ibericus]
MTNLLKQTDAQGTAHISANVFKIFNDYMAPESSATAAQAAAAVSKLLPDPADGSNTLDDGFFFTLWNDIINIAVQIPHDHPAMDKLVKVMRELTLLPDTGLRVWDSRLWTDLPVLGAAFRERLNGPGTSKKEEEQAVLYREWVRFHAFSAKLIGAGVINYTNQAVWMLRDALEEDTSAKAPNALNRDLVAASMYIEYAGPILAESIVRTPDPTLSKEDERPLRAGPLYDGKAGLRSDRWLFWLKRFREQAEKATTDEARSLALRSSRLMEIWVEKRLQPKS